MSDSTIKALTSMSELSFLLDEKRQTLEDLSTNFSNYYYPFKKTKKNSNDKRQIEPTRQSLKNVQKKINSRILKKFNYPTNMIGGIEKKTIKDNVSIHLNQPMVVSLDIKKCFPSTNYQQVFLMFKSEFQFTSNIASLLTRLTTYREHVPQGAPSSTLIVNLCLLPMHRKISQYCKLNKINYTLWVDDITLSGVDSNKHISKIIKIVMSYGYTVSNRKILVMPSNIRQIVTGVIVNGTEPSISKEKFKLYKDTAYLSLLDKSLEKKLIGQLAHVNFINQNQGQKLRSIMQINQ